MADSSHFSEASQQCATGAHLRKQYFRSCISCFQLGESRAANLAKSFPASMASFFPPRPRLPLPPACPGQIFTTFWGLFWTQAVLVHISEFINQTKADDDDTSFSNLTSHCQQRHDLPSRAITIARSPFFAKICFCVRRVKNWCAIARKDLRNWSHVGILDFSVGIVRYKRSLQVIPICLTRCKMLSCHNFEKLYE